MIRSMTGFGRAEDVSEHRKITVELKSVNHRYLDINVKIPVRFGFLELPVRNYLKERLERGKVDIYIGYQKDGDLSYTVHYNSELAAMYLKNLNDMADEFKLDNDIKLSNLSRYPDVFEIQEKEQNTDELWNEISVVLEKAVDSFVQSRENEGERIAEDLFNKLDTMTELVDKIEEKSPMIIEEYKAKLVSKVQELLDNNQIDDNRIAAEVTIYADKICVDEEIVRLKSHIMEMQNTLSGGNDVGRRLDFIAQEMNREANTILSKSTNAEIADIGIDLKTLIEKIREQIQNLE